MKENNNNVKKKILFINSGIHHKNMQGLKLLKNIQIDFIDSIEQCIHLNEYEFVYFPSQTFDVSKYPDTKFVFGQILQEGMKKALSYIRK